MIKLAVQGKVEGARGDRGGYRQHCRLRRSKWHKLEAGDDNFSFLMVARRGSAEQPQVQAHVFVTGWRHGQRVGPLADDVRRAGAGQEAAALALESHAVGLPGPQERRVGLAGRHRVAREVTVEIVWLDNI